VSADGMAGARVVASPALVLLLNMPWGTFIRWAKEEAKSKKEVI
jgi:hypothetical protein